MSNQEIQEAAWARLFKDGWFWRLFWGGVLLGICGRVVQMILGGVLSRLGVVDWFKYMEIVEANRADLVTPIPELTRDFIWTATTASGLELFVGWIMAGIVAYGSGVILVRSLNRDSEGWLRAAFGGFKMPLGLLALMVRFALIWLGWMILSIPTLGLLLLVPFYRYRFLWLVKAEHSDWSAGECLKVTRRLMEGNKMRSFKLDCSYWKPLTVLLVSYSVMIGLLLAAIAWDSGIVFFVALLAFFFMIIASIIIAHYIKLGQALLYRELSPPRGN